MSWYKRNYVIDPRVQLKIVGFLASIAVVMSIIICALAYKKVNQLGVLFTGSVVPPALQAEVFETLARSLMFSLIAIVTVMILVFSIAGIILTHRVAGPIWRLQAEIRRHLNGEKIHPIRFRKNDEFKELADLVNQLISKQ